MVKIGLARCEIASRYCPEISCFKVIKNGTGTEEFKDEDIDIIGMITCRGCPGYFEIGEIT